MEVILIPGAASWTLLRLLPEFTEVADSTAALH